MNDIGDIMVRMLVSSGVVVIVVSNVTYSRHDVATKC